MSGKPTRWKVMFPGDGGAYMRATADELREFDRAEVLTTPEGMNYKVLGVGPFGIRRVRPSRKQLLTDYKNAYKHRKRTTGALRDGSTSHLAGIATKIGPVKVTSQDVSKWSRGTTADYRHGINDGTGKDLAIRAGIDSYLGGSTAPPHPDPPPRRVLFRRRHPKRATL